MAARKPTVGPISAQRRGRCGPSGRCPARPPGRPRAPRRWPRCPRTAGRPQCRGPDEQIAVSRRSRCSAPLAASNRGRSFGQQPASPRTRRTSRRYSSRPRPFGSRKYRLSLAPRSGPRYSTPASSSFAFAEANCSSDTESAMCCRAPIVSWYVRQFVAGEVEEAEQVVVADVEEEVARAGVVAVLDQFDEREAEEVLVEPDGLLDVLADERGVVHAARAARLASLEGVQVLLAQLVRVRPDGGRVRHQMGSGMATTGRRCWCRRDRIPSLLRRTSRPGGRVGIARSRRGKSGLHRAGWLLTATRGNPRDSATENRPPARERR